ncbi:hypothetical protein N6H14_10245 [Paenibacillus sp. CC-CFT747]|nr:hypothetical protein N6H14_10245 [Paenibacillus sp. CC-CFT747]
MDWGRAKTVLIISFLMLNVLLGFQLWNSRSDKVHSLTDTAIAMEETNKLLASKNITVRMKEIPKETPKLKAVNYKETYSDKTTVSLPEPVSTVNFSAGAG